MANNRALEGQVALITGGGRGIGRAIALAFAEERASICVAARTLHETEGVAQECRQIGTDAMALELDVMHRVSCERAVAKTNERWGRIDLLVNNAGGASSQKFTDIDDELWEHALRVNLTGAFLMTRAALPEMLQRGAGVVLAIASTAGKMGTPYVTPYAAAKHGLIGMMRSLAAEYARSGVSFNCVCPGYVDTPLTRQTITRIMEKTGRSRNEALTALLTPQGRLIDPREVAALCVYLASYEGRSVNGQAINVDGGQLQS